MKFGLLAVFLALASAASSDTAEGNPPLRTGFPRSSFTEHPSIDARVAIGVFARKLQGAPAAPANLKGHVYESDKDLRNALRLGKIDLCAMNPDLFLSLRGDDELVPLLAAVRYDSPVESLLLVARAGQSLGDLRGGDLVIDNSGRGSTPVRWIERDLVDSGQGESARAFFGSIDEVSTTARALLPVFFGKSEAAIVSEQSFEAMCELNPQLRSDLEVVSKSKGFASTLICLRRGSDFRARDLTLIGETLHGTPEGRELLDLMGAARLVPFKEQFLFHDQQLHTRHDAGSGSHSPGGRSR